MKCDACEEIFCKDHVTYANHKCMSSYKKDVRVPVCPLCNTPIPIKRGEMPDIKVGEHIDRDCKSDPAQRKRKIMTVRPMGNLRPNRGKYFQTLMGTIKTDRNHWIKPFQCAKEQKY
uniref:AN1-type zinc finger protein 2B n=1 Tax=Osmerus mordax TaxID=8014 RepID=C1BIK6_OSMMO|nr:AN1-type zinc finger protein 2B [Osmerus mordax]